MKEKANDLSELKGLGKIILILAGAFIIMYLLTLGATKLGWFDTGYTKPNVEDAVISYEKIMAGSVFDKKDDSYYVAIANFKNTNNMYYQSIVSAYKSKKEHLPFYVVDLSDELNKSIISDTNNTKATKASELKVKDLTLIKITNGKIEKYITGIENIETELK